MEKKAIKDLEKRVRKILKDEPATRGSDDLLYLILMRQTLEDVENMKVSAFILNYRKWGFPSIESVGRVRRRIQAKNEALKPSREVQLLRKENEKSYYEYSLGF